MATDDLEKVKGMISRAEALRGAAQWEITRWVVMAGILALMKQYKITLVELFDFQKAKGKQPY